MYFGNIHFSIITADVAAYIAKLHIIISSCFKVFFTRTKRWITYQIHSSVSVGKKVAVLVTAIFQAT